MLNMRKAKVRRGECEKIGKPTSTGVAQAFQTSPPPG